MGESERQKSPASAGRVAIGIGLIQSVLGFLEQVANASIYGPPPEIFYLALVLSSVGPLVMAFGALRFRETLRPVFLKVAIGGLGAFVVYALITVVDGVRNWLDTAQAPVGYVIHVLWLLLPIASVRSIWNLYRWRGGA